MTDQIDPHYVPSMTYEFDPDPNFNAVQKRIHQLAELLRDALAHARSMFNEFEPEGSIWPDVTGFHAPTLLMLEELKQEMQATADESEEARERQEEAGAA